MPIYEYRCNRCGSEFQRLILNRDEAKGLRCGSCRSRSLTRLLSRFSLHQSEEARLAGFDPSKPRDESFYKDSRNVGLWAKKRMKEMGADLGSKMDEIVERGRTGKILDDYVK
jgi:putative FmdB family regulatory protein